ncbi:TetR family transcriptional regulator C-terminal domain-containing protein [Thalassobellus sediminis]|uniref:TetR family transcriptional regulator C-terminal domain-containing protein n=1 Tax=Thalassobellus sediminis TaxID=3367753 RepID=UPI00379F9D0E
MAKNKTISKNDIISFFMDYVLEHSENPKSVFAFSKKYTFEEAKFYEFFSSFEVVEKEIFQTFFHNSINALNKSEDYDSFDARNKLLSLYFTFFENLTANRSYVIYALDKHKNSLKGIKILSGLKHQFTNYIDQLDIEILDIKQEKIQKIQQKTLKESAWIQLLLTMKFWIDDSSPSFEKTDIFIEKSVNTSFDVLDIAPLKSVIDLGKFLFKEKFQMN